MKLASLIAGTRPKMLYAIIQELGLTTNLNVVLDAADTLSYDGSSQTWTDPVGANNMFRGTTSGSEATDPTFNGTAGLPTEATYFSCDGGDYFQQTAAHTYSDTWHTNNGACTLLTVGYFIDGGSARQIWSNGPDAAHNNHDGIGVSITTAEKIDFQHSTANNVQQVLTSAAAVTASSWNFVAVAYDEATTAASIAINGTIENFSPTASTATSSPPAPIRIGAGASGVGPLLNTERIACFAAWSTKISDANLTEIYKRLQFRRFLTLP